MTINTPSKGYVENAPRWSRVRDCIAGRDKVLEGADYYVPKLAGQDNEDYSAYIMRGNFYEATGRTREAFTGLVFSRPATYALPPSLDVLWGDIDAAGTDLDSFAMHVVDETLATGRGLIVVNHSGDPTIATTADKAEANGRVYLRYYSAEALISWRTIVIGGVTQLGRVVLREHVSVPSADDDNVLVDGVQYRVLDLTDAGYRQRVFVQKAKTKGDKPGDWEQIGPDVYPVLNGAPWRVMPVALVSLGRGADAEPGPVPLLPIADLNLSHWRTSVDLEHGAHFTGLPTPVVTGHELGDNEVLKLGSSEALVFTNADAKAFFLEFTGSGLSVLEKLLDRKEQHMAALGARLLAPEKAQAESGDALQIRRSGETSALSRVATSVSASMTKALQFAAVWSGDAPESASYELNKQYANAMLSAQEMAELLKQWQAGAISFETFYHNMSKGGRTRDGVSAVDEREEIANEGAAPVDGGTLGGPDPLGLPSDSGV